MSAHNELIKKILCPVDFSEQSQRTAQTAIAMAECLEAEILFLNVINESQVQAMERMAGRLQNVEQSILEGLVGNLENDRAGRMKELLAELEADKVPHASRVSVGVPWEKIIEIADSEQVDLIIMGAHGRGSLTRALRFGTSAEKVFRRAKCRVMFER